MAIAEKFADFSVNLNFDQLSPEVVERAKLFFLTG